MPEAQTPSDRSGVRWHVFLACLFAAVMVITVIVATEYPLLRRRAELLSSSASSARAVKRAVGIFCLRDLAAGDLAADPCWTSDGVDGITILAGWDALEPAPDDFRWAVLDRAADLASVHGKQLGLSVNAGRATPGWVYQMGAARYAMHEFGETGITDVQQPLPWDSQASERWHHVIQTLGRRYDAAATLSYVTVAGIAQRPGDFFVDQQQDVQFFQSADGPYWLFTHWLPAAEQTLSRYAEAFPSTSFHLVLTPPTPVSPDGQAALERLLLPALDRYEGRLGMIAPALSPMSLKATSAADRLIGMFAWQRGAGMRLASSDGGFAVGALSDALDSAVMLGAQFVELPHTIAADPALQRLLRATGDRLKSAPFLTPRASSSSSSGCVRLAIGLPPVGCYYNCIEDAETRCQTSCSPVCIRNYEAIPSPKGTAPLSSSELPSSSSSSVSAFSSEGSSQSMISSAASPSSADSSLSASSSMSGSSLSSTSSAASSASASVSAGSSPSSSSSFASSSQSSASSSSMGSSVPSSSPLSSSLSSSVPSSSSLASSQSSVAPSSASSASSSVASSAVDDAAFVSQTVPSNLVHGKTATVSVTMRNTGTTNWTRAANDKLGSQNPPDNTTWNLSRVLIPTATTVVPGAQITFTFTIRAPATPGTYNFQWRMIHEGVGWFGVLTPNIAITVL